MKPIMANIKPFKLDDVREALGAVGDAIRETANTDKIGDGKIFVIDLASTMRIRTGETGAEAL